MTPACFTVHLIVHIAPFAMIVWNDLIITSPGLAMHWTCIYWTCCLVILLCLTFTLWFTYFDYSAVAVAEVPNYVVCLHELYFFDGKGGSRLLPLLYWKNAFMNFSFSDSWFLQLLEHVCSNRTFLSQQVMQLSWISSLYFF